jgi:hypothetical protein
MRAFPRRRPSGVTNESPQWLAAVLQPPYSRASATACLRWRASATVKVARLPVREVRGNCKGAKPTVGCGEAADQVPEDKILKDASPFLAAGFCPTYRSDPKHGVSWFCQNAYPRTPGRAELHGKRRVKNLFEQFALVDRSRRADAKTFAAL